MPLAWSPARRQAVRVTLPSITHHPPERPDVSRERDVPMARAKKKLILSLKWLLYASLTC